MKSVPYHIIIKIHVSLCPHSLEQHFYLSAYPASNSIEEKPDSAYITPLCNIVWFVFSFLKLIPPQVFSLFSFFFLPSFCHPPPSSSPLLNFVSSFPFLPFFPLPSSFSSFLLLFTLSQTIQSVIHDFPPSTENFKVYVVHK